MKPLQVNLRHLEEHGLRLQDELPVDALELGADDELIHPRGPLRFDLSVELLHHAVLATGTLSLTLDCECARCLKKFESEIKLTGWAVHLPLQGEECVPVENDCVDLTPFVREDILLNFPQHPLCKPDCAGIKTNSKAHQAEPGEASRSALWADLDKLKFK